MAELIFEGLPKVNSRVSTPMGQGLVVGYVARGIDTVEAQAIVSLDQYPLPVIDHGQNPIIVYSFPTYVLEEL